MPRPANDHVYDFRRRNLLEALPMRCFIRCFSRPSFVGFALSLTVVVAILFLIVSSLRGRSFEEKINYEINRAILSGNKTAIARLIKWKNYYMKRKNQKSSQALTTTQANQKQVKLQKSLETKRVENVTTMAAVESKSVELKTELMPSLSDNEDCDKEAPLAGHRHYVVMSCFVNFYKNPVTDCLDAKTYDNGCTCLFGLPFAVAAWRRFSYEVVIFLLHHQDSQWQQRKGFKVALDLLNSFEHVHIFTVPIAQPGSDEVMLTKAVRLFGAKYIDEYLVKKLPDAKVQDPYVVTSEFYHQPASSWSVNIFDMDPRGIKDIQFVVPQGCCSHMYVDSLLADVIPAETGAGMRLSKWVTIMNYRIDNDDLVGEMRNKLHKGLADVGGAHSQDKQVVAKLFTVQYSKWIHQSEDSRACRTQLIRYENPETRIFRLPLGIQNEKIWRQVKGVVKSQVNPTNLFDADAFFLNFNGAVLKERVMEEPAPPASTAKPTQVTFQNDAKVSSNTEPGSTHVFNNNVNFLPLRLHRNDPVIPYRGLGFAQTPAEAERFPPMFDQVAQPDPQRPLTQQQIFR